MAKQFYCFLLFILFFVCHQAEARESKFFSKNIHLTQNTNKNHVTVPSITFAKKDLSLPSLLSPAPAPAPLTSYISNAPTPTGSSEYGSPPTPLGNAPSVDASPSPSPSLSPAESENFYYGLYARDTNSFVSDANTNVDNEQEKDEFPGYEFNNDNSELLNSRDSNKFVDSYPDNLNKENPVGTSNQEGYNNNLNNFDVGYTNEPQGMSDTRFVDNGKYYYGAEQENAVPVRPQTRNNNDGGYPGAHYDPKSKYEFDTMEEYEKQEGYPEYPQEFNP